MSQTVWGCCLLTIIIIFATLILEIKHPDLQGRISTLDSATFILGAVCQQGTHLVISTTSGRFVVLTTFLAALAMFTSYSANIVALLQSPSTSIKTIEDLIASPLKIGIQDAGYTRYYYMKMNDPLLNLVYQKKIKPIGTEGWIYDTDVGIEKIRTELFACQIEEKPAYRAISRTYTEHEKCSLSEVHIVQLPITTMTVERHFPLSELFKIR